MQYPLIPMCYFPGTVLFLHQEDGQLFSQLVEPIANRLVCVSLTDPTQALAHLERQQVFLTELRTVCMDVYLDSMQCVAAAKPIHTHLAAIHAEIYNPLRFSEVTVMVIEADFPDLDVLAFCKEIKNSQIKKLIIASTEHEAIFQEALQRGDIDGIIDNHAKKALQDRYFWGTVAEKIMALHRHYFQSVSELAARLLGIEPLRDFSDHELFKRFHEICQAHAVVEYYWVDPHYFLLLDTAANPIFFMINEFEPTHSETKFMIDQRKVLSYTDYLERVASEAPGAFTREILVEC